MVRDVLVNVKSSKNRRRNNFGLFVAEMGDEGVFEGHCHYIYLVDDRCKSGKKRHN